MPGVTTVLSKTVPKAALVDWSARTGGEFAGDNWDSLAQLPISQRIKAISGAYRTVRDTAAHRGTEVHRLAAQLTDTDEPVAVPDELAGHVEAFRDWLDRFDVAPVEGASELVVASRAHRYCGTADLVADLPAVFADGELIDACRWLLELKTTQSGVFPESAIQATAYRRADIYVHPDHPDDEQPMDLLGIRRAGVVWIKSDACQLHPLDTSDSAWEFFLRLRWLYDRQDDMDTWIGSPAEPVRVLAPVT